jgi:selenide,water dikinase
MGPEALAQVLRPLAGMFHADAWPDLLRGLGEPDDAAVWKLDAERALVLTADFFPPVVDDPYAYGAIAAANALSDLYAMGAVPLFALNLASFPADLDPAVIAEIVRGGADKVREAGAVIAGGHTTTDPEPKFGLAAAGLVHPDRVLTKGGARPGDVFLLTKPLGTGLITTAAMRDLASPAELATAIASMSRLNQDAARLLRTLPPGAVHALTDVTGFGLGGHAHEMAMQSGLAVRFDWEAVPLLSGADRYAREGTVLRRGEAERRLLRGARAGGVRPPRVGDGSALRSPDLRRAPGRRGGGARAGAPAALRPGVRPRLADRGGRGGTGRGAAAMMRGWIRSMRRCKRG